MLEKTQHRTAKTRSLVNVLVLAVIALLLVSKFKDTRPTNVQETFQCQEFESRLGKPVSELSRILESAQLQNETLSKLANAVRVPTEMYDYFPDPHDEPGYKGWEPFPKLHQQLAHDFPLVWSKLSVERVNEYALLLTWQGSQQDLKPVLFAAHQDVVPVEKKTWDMWEHEPFSGFWDGQFLWGRGSFDDKNMLIGVLQAVEYILQEEPDFEPKRGVVIALGSDEESSGRYGAKYLNTVLLDRYGTDGIYSIIDEGVNGIKNVEDVWIAAPGTGEKGFINVQFDVRTPGGHSSVPPDHTSIGISAEIIRNIEALAFPPQFTPENPVTQYYQCAAQYSETMDRDLRLDFLSAMEDEEANYRALHHLIKTGGKKTECLFRTTRAFDIINGGIKANALPETVSFLLNSRVSVESTVDKTVSVFFDVAFKVAKKYGLGYSFDGHVLLKATAKGIVEVAVERSLEPAPVSPNNEVWREFAGSIKGFYEEVVFPKKFQNNSTSLVVAPSIMTANTDTCHYWQLTKNIYRYQPGFAMEDTLSTIHSVNEHVDSDTVMQVVAFFYNYIHLVNDN